MNIRVDFNYPIKDGTELRFRSPVDCSQVTGLKVYYRENGITASKEFAFADAHGNNVGDIDHLFAENVVVKVILDVTTGMAFVQNADTNAYIERTFIKTVNGKTPDENGNVEIAGGGSGETGKDGKDGVSATHSWNGTVLTINSASGTSSADLKGPKGDPGHTPVKGKDYFDGEPGKTPAKGTDYYTEADKAEMVQSVISALPVYDGSVVSV